MSIKHTAGPWRLGDAGRTIFGPKSDEAAPVTIATLPPPSPRVSVGERKANAALLLEAPEVIEMLSKAVALMAVGLNAGAYDNIAAGRGYAERVLTASEKLCNRHGEY